MSAIIIFGWEVPAWAGHISKPLDDDGEEYGPFIDDIFPSEASYIMKCSRVPGHYPDDWVFGIKDTIQAAPAGELHEIGPMWAPSAEEQDMALRRARTFGIPVPASYGAGPGRWYLLEEPEYD